MQVFYACQCLSTPLEAQAVEPCPQLSTQRYAELAVQSLPAAERCRAALAMQSFPALAKLAVPVQDQFVTLVFSEKL